MTSTRHVIKTPRIYVTANRLLLWHDTRLHVHHLVEVRLTAVHVDSVVDSVVNRTRR